MFNEGQKVGLFTLIKKLGKGGFGEVWLAEKKTKLVTKKVAVKLPNVEQVDIEAIKQEAMLWEKVSGHANVLPIIDADIYDGQVVIVSEYARDGSLDNRLKKEGKLPITKAIELTIGILNGLEFLHSKFIIHRDIKPQNILLQGKTPRLADFGISRAMQTTMLSSTIGGTDSYMSPESLDGQRNIQSDIWSVGVVLYELLSGTLPFPQEHPAERMFAIISKEPVPLPNEIPENIAQIVAKALKKNTAERYQTAIEMREDLKKTIYQTQQSFSKNKTEEVLITNDLETTSENTTFEKNTEQHTEEVTFVKNTEQPTKVITQENIPPTQQTFKPLENETVVAKNESIETKFQIPVDNMKDPTHPLNAPKFAVSSRSIPKKNRKPIYISLAVGLFGIFVVFGVIGAISFYMWNQSQLAQQHFEEAEKYRKKENYNVAISFYDKAIKIDPKFIEAYNYRGLSFTNLKKYDKAKADFDKAIEVDENYYKAYNNRGIVFSEEGKFLKALADYDKAIKLNPNDYRAFSNKGVAHSILEEYNKAISAYNKAIELNKTDSQIFAGRGYSLKNIEKYFSAIDDFTKAIDLDSKNSYAYVQRGYTYQLQDKYDEAIDDADKAIELNSENAEALTLRGSTLYHAKKNHQNALLDLNKAIKLDTNNFYAIYIRGYIYTDKKEYSKALADFSKAIKLSPENSDSYFQRAYIYDIQGKLNEALTDLNKSIELDPKNSTAYNNRGVIYEKKGDNKKARADFRKAVELDPNNQTAKDNLNP